MWLRVDQLWGEWGIPKDSPAGRAEFVYEMGGNFLGPCEGGGEAENRKLKYWAKCRIATLADCG